ncbi:unnamed protein product [Phytomonas sp. Hart1]|nr:unnamed protein product [Phytomonas sp. Hart1]|eukprot:CCW66241.1 unnamed protein product [Phytomonas sp. isolate Hart1]
MISFKKIAEFLKKVGSRDTCSPGGKDTKNAKCTSNVTTEIPSAFVDKSSPISNILRGLPPNASEQAVLLHIRAMVERRIQSSRKTGLFSAHDESKRQNLALLGEVGTQQPRVSSSAILSTGDALTKGSSSMAQDLKGGNTTVASTSSGSCPQHQEGALPSVTDMPACYFLNMNLGKGDGTSNYGEFSTPGSTLVGTSEWGPAILDQVEDIDTWMASLEQEKAELIEALDVCLQEVPEMNESELQEHIRQCIAKRETSSRNENKTTCTGNMTIPFSNTDMQPHDVAHSIESDKKDNSEGAYPLEETQASSDPVNDQKGVVDGNTTPQPSSNEPSMKSDLEIMTIYEWRQLLLSLVELLIYTERDILYQQAFYTQRKGQEHDNMIFALKHQQKQDDMLPSACEFDALPSLTSMEDRRSSKQQVQQSMETNTTEVEKDGDVPSGAPQIASTGSPHHQPQQHVDPTAMRGIQTSKDTTAKIKAASQELAKSIDKVLSAACSLAAWIILRSMLQKHIIRLETTALEVSRSQETASSKHADKTIEKKDKETGKSDIKSPEFYNSTAGIFNTKQNVLTVDWPEVINNLRGLLSPFGPSMAECVICASFLRDDGLELMMCMLQEPYERSLVKPIVTSDEKWRRLQSVFMNRTKPTGGNQPDSGVSCPQSSHIPIGNASGGCGNSNTSGGGSTKHSPVPTTGSSSLIHPQPVRSSITLPPQLLAANFNAPTLASIPDGPTLDDFLAEVELAYREGVLKSWSEYLKQILFVRDEDDGRFAVGASVMVSTNTTTATQAGTSATDERTTKSSSETPIGIQAQNGLFGTIDSGCTPQDCDFNGLLHNVNCTTICQLATAFFFCSDEWKSKCQRARFDFLHSCIHRSALRKKTATPQELAVLGPDMAQVKQPSLPIEEHPVATNGSEGLTTNYRVSTFSFEDEALIQNSSKNTTSENNPNDDKNFLDMTVSPEQVNIISGGLHSLSSTLSFHSCNPSTAAILEPGAEGSSLSNDTTAKGYNYILNSGDRSSAEHQYLQPALCAVGKEVLMQITKMSWAAALHKRVEHCITDQPPALELASKYAREERQVSGMLNDFRARQRALNSILKSHLSAGRSHEALPIANRHFKNERKEWSSRAQTIFSAMHYLHSMVQLVQAQAACRAYGAVIETGQFVLLQCSLCEQMLEVISPKPRGAFILRFGKARMKLLNTKVYLMKELWYAYAMFNNNARAEKLFDECVKNILQLRNKLRDNELFGVLMKRGKQLMNMQEFHSAVELFKHAVTISSAAQKKNQMGYTTGVILNSNNLNSTLGGVSLQSSPSITTAIGSPSQESNPTVTPTPSNAASANPRVVSNAFSVNLHLHRAGSSDPSSADEHPHVLTPHEEEELELGWKVAESQRMLALAFVTQAEHEVNVPARRVQLSNAVNNAYASQASLQKWQSKGGTPKRMLTAVPSSLIVTAKALLLLGQPKKAALLLEPLIEAKPNAVPACPPMWDEILDPTMDPLTAEDIALRIYVNSVRIAVFQLYGQCLSKFDGERGLRVVERTRTLLQDSFYWMHVVRRKICLKQDQKSYEVSSLNLQSKSNPRSSNGPLYDTEDGKPVIENTPLSRAPEVECPEGIENHHTDFYSQVPRISEERMEAVIVPNLTSAEHPQKNSTSVHEAFDADGHITDIRKIKKVEDLFQRIDVFLGSKSERVTALRALQSGCLEVREAHCEFEITAGDTLSLLCRWEDALEAYFRTLVICLNENEAAAETCKRGKSMASRGGNYSSASTVATPAETFTKDLDVSALTLDLLLMEELNQEFDDEEEEIMEGIGTINPSTSTGAKDLRAVIAYEEQIKCKVCENMALSRIANVYKALGKPKIAIQYLKPVLEYAKESNNTLVEYQSMLSLSRLYTITEEHELAQEMWERVSAFAKKYEDKEVSRETLRNIVTVQEAARLFPDIIRTAEELKQLALAAEGTDAASDLRYALEALANSHLQLAHYKECIEVLDEREKVQEKSGEWNGKLLELRARARLGNGEVADAIKILSTWVNKARQLQNWSEFGRANGALGAAYIAKGDNYAAHRWYLLSLQSFSHLKGDISHQDKLCVIESARWLVQNYYLNKDKMQVNVELPQPGITASTHPGVDGHANKGLINNSIFASGGEVYESGLHNHSGDLAQMLEEDDRMRSGCGIIKQDQSCLVDDNISTFLDSIQNHSFSGMSMYLDKSKDTNDSTLENTSPADLTVPSNKTKNNSGKISPKENPTSTVGNNKDDNGIRINTNSPISFETAQKPENADIDKTPVRNKGGHVTSPENYADGEPLHNAVESKPQASSLEEKQKPSCLSPVTATLTTTITKHTTAIPSMTSTNVSMCSRPAAAMAGTDALNGVGSSDAHSNVTACVKPPGKTHTACMTNTTPLMSEVLHNHVECCNKRPSKVSTLCYRMALQIMEWATRLIHGSCTIPHCRYVIPYSPAEGVDLALLTHPRCVFVFFFAEYVTESSAAYNVIIRPANHVHFMHRYAQVTTLKEYCNKKLLSGVVKKAAKQAAIGTDPMFAYTLDTTKKAIPQSLTLELPSGEIPSKTESVGSLNRKNSAMCEASTGSASFLSSTIVEHVLECEIRTQLKYLYDELWRPVQSSFRRANLNLSDAECLIIVADPSLLRVPFHALLPNSDDLFPGERNEPLGQQATLVVTPSVTHLVQFGVSRRENDRATPPLTIAALNHKQKKIIFLPEEEARANNRNINLNTVNLGESEPALHGTPSVTSPQAASDTTPNGGVRNSTQEISNEPDVEDPFAPLRSCWSIHAGCTRKELLNAFADPQNHVIMALNSPVDDRLKVADGVIGLRDLASARGQETGEGETSCCSGACTAHGLDHLELLVIAVDRGVSTSETEPVGALSLCLELRCTRVLLLNIITGTSINSMHKEFLVLYLKHLDLVRRYDLKFPYALALRMTLRKAIEKEWPVKLWGAFTLVGAP